MEEIKANAVYTREEAEKLLKISRTTMKRLLQQGVIRAGKVGNQYRILGSELLRQVLPDAGYQTARELYRVSKKMLKDIEKELEEEIAREKEESRAIRLLFYLKCRVIFLSSCSLALPVGKYRQFLLVCRSSIIVV